MAASRTALVEVSTRRLTPLLACEFAFLVFLKPCPMVLGTRLRQLLGQAVCRNNHEEQHCTNNKRRPAEEQVW
jgi:hypothetical protein